MRAARVRLELPAPPATVWHAFTDPDALASWFWPPSFGTAVTADPRVGGGYRIAAAPSPARPSGLAVSGEYTTVEPGRRLGFTWRWDGDGEVSEVTVELAGVEATTLTLVHAGFAQQQAVADHTVGWTDCLDRLRRRLAAA